MFSTSINAYRVTVTNNVGGASTLSVCVGIEDRSDLGEVGGEKGEKKKKRKGDGTHCVG